MIWRGTHLRPLSQGPEHASGVAGGTSNSSYDVATLKSQLRRHMRSTRVALPPATARRAALRASEHLLRLGRLRRARCVAVYLTFGAELDTAPLIRALHRAHKRVLVPAIDPQRDATMHMVPLNPGTPLRSRRYGIGEPVDRRRILATRIDVMVLPLLMFDRIGTRLGSGAGYYDRWLARAPFRPYCVGYGFAMQEAPALPREAHDQRLDAVCTERGLRRFAAR